MAEQIRHGEPMVKVRLLIDQVKDDCRAYTPIVWSGIGDVQEYPLRLWPLLKPHYDVWELVDDSTPEERTLGVARKIKTQSEELKGQGTDTVTVLAVRGRLLTPEEIANCPIEELQELNRFRKYKLNPRLKESNMREQFAIEQVKQGLGNPSA